MESGNGDVDRLPESRSKLDMKSSEIYLGFDLGTTVLKTTAVDEQGLVIHRASLPTPWVRPRPGCIELGAETLLGLVDSLLKEVVLGVLDQNDSAVIRGIGFTSIGESGVLVDSADRPAAPIIAWYDRRGEAQSANMDPMVAGEFPAMTGLSVSAVASVFKLAWMREQGINLRIHQWLSIPEFVCRRLGGRRVSELSLLGRTGLLDIHSLQLWEPSLEFLDVSSSFVPERVGAGQPLGRVRSDHPVVAARGAVLCIAGHDHLVAAAAAGASEPGAVMNSMGTAEVLIAAVDATPSPASTKELTSHGLATYPHVVESTTCMIGGLRSGLVYQRLLRLLGAQLPARRNELDRLCLELADDNIDDVGVFGLRLDDDAIGIELLSDNIDPVRAWAGAVNRVRNLVAETLDTMRHHGVAINKLVLTGGWSQMESVRSARTGLAPDVRRATVTEPGSWGAARFALWATEQEESGGLASLMRPPASFFDHSGEESA